MADLWEYVSRLADLEDAHGRFTKTLKYILNTNGGMAWPLLSFFLFAYAWNELGSVLEDIRFHRLGHVAPGRHLDSSCPSIRTKAE